MTQQLTKLHTYPRSRVRKDGTTYQMAREAENGRKWLIVTGNSTNFAGTVLDDGSRQCTLTPQNAAELRHRLPWLRPVALGQRTSAGFGDRLGLATPGHAEAARGTGIAPIFAQQSVRENGRTGRTPQEVMDDAMWGVFQAGWQDAWGADADHLKTPGDLRPFVAAGYTFFTIDPGEHVDGNDEKASLAFLNDKVSVLPWDVLRSSPGDLSNRLLERTISLPNLTLVFDESTLLHAAAKYGRAVAHTAVMYQHLKELMAGTPFDLEVSVDETETPTSVHEHFYVAHELQRLGVPFVSLAPRFTGRFEKGVDYIGDPATFAEALAAHTAVMRHVGGYKLSLHSGSDKFTLYPLIARHTQGLVHLKTAGTSYLEALRVIARVQPALFRDILELARSRFPADRATFYVSAQLHNVPHPAAVADGDLPDLLEQFDTRQVLHVTFGSVLARFGDQVMALLAANEPAYIRGLKHHFTRHLAPLVENGV